MVLEGLADHHLWLWHNSHGCVGTLNDANTMNLSPLFDSLLDGRFEEREQAVCPCCIGEESFQKLHTLVDGIHPRHSRFVKGMKEPVTREEKLLTAFQESARKDVERAFGVLQAKFQAMARPIVLMDLKLIANLCSACVIMHNMCVSDGIMGHVRARCNPAHDIEPETEEEVEHSEEFKRKRKRATAPIGIRNADPCVQKLLRRKERWKDLVNLEECQRLHVAPMKFLSS